MSPDIGIEETSHSHSNQAREAARSSRWAVLPAVAVGALAGVVATNLLTRPPAALAAREVSAPHTATAWLAMARRLSEPGSGRAMQGTLTQALASDAPLFRAIVEEYGRTEERRFRATLRELIVASARPDISGAGTELAHDPRGLQRGAGFELLARLSPTPERYAMARRAVFEDTDPTALAGALMALHAPGLPSNADAQQLLPRFLQLTHHPDSLVRGHAIQQLSDWDKSGEQATPIVLDAISDPDHLIREAAVGAVMIGGLHSEGLKRALLRTAGNSGEDPTLRGSALQALDRFSLTDAEQAQFRADQDELERLTMTLEKQNHTQER